MFTSYVICSNLLQQLEGTKTVHKINWRWEHKLGAFCTLEWLLGVTSEQQSKTMPLRLHLWARTPSNSFQPSVGNGVTVLHLFGLCVMLGDIVALCLPIAKKFIWRHRGRQAVCVWKNHPGTEVMTLSPTVSWTTYLWRIIWVPLGMFMSPTQNADRT